MTLQASGSISMGQIQDEFGGFEQISLSQCYRGGNRVANITPNAGVPTSGAIALSDFYSTRFGVTGTMTRAAGLISAISVGQGYSLNPYSSWDAPFGSLGAPGSNQWKGATIAQIATLGTNLILIMGGTPIQSVFDSFVCSLGTFTSAGADSFAESAGYGTWTWNAAGTLTTSGTEVVQMW